MKPFELWATCASTSADIKKLDYPRYWLTAHPSGHATCTCADWLNRGGACRHLQAFCNLIISWVQSSQITHKFHFPESQSDAYNVFKRNKSWYGHYYEHSVMVPVSQDTSSPTHPPTLRKSQTHVPLPPPNLPEVLLIPTIDQEAELEESIASLDDTTTIKSTITGSSTKLMDNCEAIAIQNQQCFNHFVTSSLPSLYGISNLLWDFRPDVINVEFSNLISTLLQQLPSTALASNPPPSITQPHTSSPPRTPTK